MKKIMILLLLLLLCALPAYAEGAEQGTLYIDEQQQQVETMVKDGKTYVPLRFFAEKFGAEVEYNSNKEIHVSNNEGESNKIVRPKVNGVKGFKDKVHVVLDKLQKYDYVHYKMVCENVETVSLVSQEKINEIFSDVNNVKKQSDFFEGREIYFSKSNYEDGQLLPEVMIMYLIHNSVHMEQYRHGRYDYTDVERMDVEAWAHTFIALGLVGADESSIENKIDELEPSGSV